MAKKIKDEDSFDLVEKQDNTISFSLVEVIVIIIIAILFGGIIGSAITLSRVNNGSNSSSSELSDFVVSYNNIVSDYYDEVDKEKLINAAIDGMMNSLGDPYSTFMDSKEAEEFNTTVSGEYKGIGATIGLIDGNATVVDIFDGSPADKAGIKLEDIIIRVNGTEVKGMELDKVVSLIKEKSQAELVIKRGEEEKTITIKLGNVEIPSVVSEIIERDGKQIGLIAVSVFAANTYEQFNEELKALEDKSIDSLIIDVRDNPGGHLDQVTKVLSLFMDKKKVIYQVQVNKKKTKVYSVTNEKREYDIAILINGSSASASEILAAAMKESYGATLIGKKSYGKGTVQKEYTLSNGASIKYTIEQWLTPKGNSINGEGVSPDVDVELESKYYETYLEEDDNQLQAAIDELTKKKD